MPLAPSDQPDPGRIYGLEERLVISHHEAGHPVVATLVGLPVRRLTLDPCPDFGGIAFVGNDRAPHLLATCPLPRLAPMHDESSATRHLLCTVAGVVVEAMLHFPLATNRTLSRIARSILLHERHAADDLLNAVVAIDVLPGANHDNTAILTGAIRDVVTLISHATPWAIITAVALALCRHGRHSPGEVARHIERYNVLWPDHRAPHAASSRRLLPCRQMREPAAVTGGP